jgi:hypothetical protein
MKKLNRKQLEQNRHKLEREKEKAAYIQKMKLVADTLGGPGTFSLLPPIILNVAYSLRYLPVVVTAVNHSEFTQRTVTSAHNRVKQLMRYATFAINTNGKQVLLADFCTAGFTLFELLEWAKTYDKAENTEDGFEWVNEFVKRLGGILTEELCTEALKHLYEVTNSITLRHNNLEEYFFWITIEIKAKEKSKQTAIKLNLNRRKAETRYFDIDGQRRLSHCVSFATSQHGFIEMKVKLQDIGIKNSDPDKEVKIYIQKHALRRLEERIDCLTIDEIHASIFTSFFNPEVVKATKNRILIAFSILNSKVGYLSAEYIDDALLIHTFLFITNNGTPEGQKLTELTGLGKLDKKYLIIDKLSSFINSDIGENEKLRNIFEKAGCSCLFNIEETITKISTKHADHSITELILKYLKTEDELPSLENIEERTLPECTFGESLEQTTENNNFLN